MGPASETWHEIESHPHLLFHCQSQGRLERLPSAIIIPESIDSAGERGMEIPLWNRREVVVNTMNRKA
jgi:hypothetical protein